MDALKKTLFLLLILFSVFLTGCDAGLEIVGMEIYTYPSKLIYVAGIDTELDLTGGEVYLILRQGRAGSRDNMYCDAITVTHDIDFSVPGIYVVTLTRHRGTAQFEIEVVSSE